MQIPSRIRNDSGTANLTPMIDVVFLLIIFFLVSSHLARQELRVPLKLPTAGSTNQQDPGASALTVNVMPEGNTQINSVVVDAGELAERFKSHHNAHGPDAAIRIRTERSVPYQQVQRVLRAAAAAGLWNISFNVRPLGEVR